MGHALVHRSRPSSSRLHRPLSADQRPDRADRAPSGSTRSSAAASSAARRRMVFSRRGICRFAAWRCADLMAKLRPQIHRFVGVIPYPTGAVMMRRAITLVLSCTALSGCGALPNMPSLSLPSFNMPSFSVHGAPAGTPVHVTSVPPGAKASFGRDDQSCTTPCTLIATNGTGTFNVSFTLKGYQPQSVPVRIAMNESSSVQSGDSGSAPSTVITPDPVMAELAPFAPGAMKPPAARTKTKPAKTTAATSAPPPASSPPPVSTTAATSGPPPPSSPPPPPVTTAETSAPPSASSPPPATTTAATSASPPDLSPPPAVMTTAATSAPPPASSPQPPATTTVETSSPPSADSLARNGKPGVWDTVSRWWNGR